MKDGGRKMAPGKPVAIAPFLRSCPRVVTLGVRASIGDYTLAERRMLLSATQVFFPTPRFAGILHAAGKETFPSLISYGVRKSRLIQQVLFQFLKCPHPVTRIYYGRQKDSIGEHFSFPFRAMGSKMPDSVRRISNGFDLRAVSGIYNPLIIQELWYYQERLKLVFVNYECVGMLRRIPGSQQNGSDRWEVLSGSDLDRWAPSECFGTEMVSRLEKLFRSVRLNDIAAEIGITPMGWHLIELARPPRSWPTPRGPVDRYNLISRMIEHHIL